jgi:hypothetical protein
MTPFLTPEATAEWRILSRIPGWQITKPWGEKFRALLSRLDPPFVSFGVLLLLFLFATPLWAILILTDEDQSAGVKALAGGFLIFWVVLLLSVAR